MATNTPNINLFKPAYTDNADVAVFNANSDKIDAAVKALQDLITALQTSTTPQAILNAIKTVDGTGSGLDADLLDGKDSNYFAKSGFGGAGEYNLKFNDIDNFKNSSGEYITGNFFASIISINPLFVFHISQYSSNIDGGFFVFQTATAVDRDSNKIYSRKKWYGTWQPWEQIGGGNLFTYPKTFNVINAQAGQTVFSYSGGAGRVITTHMANTSPEITIDGSVVTYASYPYSGTGATGTSQVINLEFKNSVIIKTVQAATGNVTGIIQTENP